MHGDIKSNVKRRTSPIQIPVSSCDKESVTTRNRARSSASKATNEFRRTQSSATHQELIAGMDHRLINKMGLSSKRKCDKNPLLTIAPLLILGKKLHKNRIFLLLSVYLKKNTHCWLRAQLCYVVTGDSPSQNLKEINRRNMKKIRQIEDKHTRPAPIFGDAGQTSILRLA